MRGMTSTMLPARQARSRQSLERLLASATEILNREGLDGASVPEIAARAGLTPGAIYRRFPNKDALLREVCLRVLEANASQSRALMEPERWRSHSLAEILTYITEETLRGHARHRELLRALARFTLEATDAQFARRSQDLQWQVFRAAADLLLSRRDEMRHPDPASAVPMVLMLVGVAAKGTLTIARDAGPFAALLPDVGKRFESELPKMVLGYLGVTPPPRRRARPPRRRRAKTTA
jgi:AcrR family transcriptional regulator